MEPGVCSEVLQREYPIGACEDLPVQLLLAGTSAALAVKYFDYYLKVLGTILTLGD